MSAGLTETITIETNKALASEWEGQLLKLSMQRRLLQKYSANEIEAIHNKYAPLKEEVKNKMDSLDKEHITSEYQELMTELNELTNKEDQEVEQAEQRVNDREGELQLEQSNLESRLEAVKKDTESEEEMRKQNIERSFGYFQT